MRSLPSYEQVVLTLTAGPRVVVPAAYGDANGHVNVRHHLGLYDDAEWAIFDGIGLGDADGGADVAGIFALEQHLTYRREVLVGDDVSVHLRVLACEGPLLHLVSYLANHTRGEVAGCMEALEGCVDLTTRRLAPFPVDAGAAIGAMAAAAARLDWQPELSGAITLRS